MKQTILFIVFTFPLLFLYQNCANDGVSFKAITGVNSKGQTLMETADKIEMHYAVGYTYCFNGECAESPSATIDRINNVFSFTKGWYDSNYEVKNCEIDLDLNANEISTLNQALAQMQYQVLEYPDSCVEDPDSGLMQCSIVADATVLKHKYSQEVNGEVEKKYIYEEAWSNDNVFGENYFYHSKQDNLYCWMKDLLEVADQEGLCPFDKTIEGLETLMGKDLEDLSCD